MVLLRLERLLAEIPSDETVAEVVVGLAGAGAPARARPLADALGKRYPGARIVVVRDIDLVAAQLDVHGAALVVGTGTSVLAPGAGDGEVMIDGRGFAIGDRGGGAWIGLEATRHALRAFDLEGAERPLLRALRNALGLPDDRGFAAALADGGAVSPSNVARLAPYVLALAQAGDPDSLDVVQRAVAEIGHSVRAALHRASVPPGAEIVATGGLLRAAVFADRLKAEIVDESAVVRLRRVDPLDARI
jgi:N-acetylglucosamine kinase-like BadF-type ATPase